MRHVLNRIFLAVSFAVLASFAVPARAQESVDAPSPAPAENVGSPEIPEEEAAPAVPKTGEDDPPAEEAPPESAPAAAADGVGETEFGPDGGLVNLQSGMSLEDMVKTVSEITSEVYLLGEDIKDKKVVIITPQGGFTRENAFRLFEILLDMNGYSVIGINGVNKIVKKKGIKTETLPLRLEDDPGETSHRYVMRLIKLRSVEAKGLSKVRTITR